MSEFNVPTNHKDEVFKVILDRDGLHQFLTFMSKQDSSEVDYGVNKYGEVFINIKKTNKISIHPINFFNIINDQIKKIKKGKDKLIVKDKVKQLTDSLKIIYEIIENN